MTYRRWVYFIQKGRFVKIGFATNLSRRLDEIGRGMPGLRLMAYMPGSRALEKELHRRFAESRISGEWYRISDELRAVMRACAAVKNGAFAPRVPPEAYDAAWERNKYWGFSEFKLEQLARTDPRGVRRELEQRALQRALNK